MRANATHPGPLGKGQHANSALSHIATSQRSRTLIPGQRGPAEGRKASRQGPSARSPIGDDSRTPEADAGDIEVGAVLDGGSWDPNDVAERRKLVSAGKFYLEAIHGRVVRAAGVVFLHGVLIAIVLGATLH